MLDGGSDIIVSLDHTGKIIYSNEAGNKNGESKKSRYDIPLPY